MFKKLYHEIQELQKYVDAAINDMHDFYRATVKDLTSIKNSVGHMAKIESLEKTIESQQQTIKALTGALVNKYEHGLFVFSEDCKVVTAIRNGKEIPVNLMDYFEISWRSGEAPNITMEQFAGTSRYSDI